MEIFRIMCELLIPILVFGALFVIGNIIYKKLVNSESRILNPAEYFPEEELETLKQVFYLIMMLIFFFFILYITIVQTNEILPIALLQILISLYIALTLDYDSWKNKMLFFLLVPYESVMLLITNDILLIWPIYIIHILLYAYFIKVYFDKFRQYTETNGLGITIILLFSVVFLSFIVTLFAEGVEPLNSIVMVSNAFTSNGYAILGNTGVGKLTSLLLVWSGYTISGVGTATLTAAILLKHNKKREKELNERLDELESLIINNK
ncbi:hypothetical protein [Methanobrevibacter sp.]|uniref:hypothetical protein n=1 Tax=Methanobrevibacter sp. TaxID=66852 RepID=UPI0025EEA900|nr:hypothetical protein [Methanobrevibacter sp.]MBQ2665426.1 hypothetical protein [Methanobrevibacter sp.]